MRSTKVIGIPANSSIAKSSVAELIRQLDGYAVSATSETATATSAPAAAPSGDMVLVTRFLGRRTELNIYPSHTTGVLITPQYHMRSEHNQLVENEYYGFRTELYDAAGGNMIWSGTSEVYVKGSQQKVLESQVGTVLKRLEQLGLLAPAGKKQPNDAEH